MKKKFFQKALIISIIIVILYYFSGHDFLTFYTGGKAELLATAEQINKRCNADGSCPTSLVGWTTLSHRTDMLSKGSMLYLVTADNSTLGGDTKKQNQTFRLIYQFAMPDNWYEAQGGVGQRVTSVWMER